MARRKQAHLARNTQDCSDGGPTKMASTKETSSACPPSTPRKTLTSSALKTQNDCKEDASNNSIEPEAWEDEEDDEEYEKSSRNDRVEHEDEENDRDSDESRRRTPRKGQLRCSLCGENVNSQHELTVHLRQHNDGTEAVAPPPTASSPSHTCSVCGKRLSSAASLDRHMLVHSGERPFRCRLCGMTFTTNGNMHRHMRAHHEVEQQQQSLLQHQHNLNPSPSPAKRHRAASHVTPKKRSAAVQLLASADADDGQVSTDPTLNCPICVKSFLCKYGLQSHMESEHPAPSADAVDAATGGATVAAAAAAAAAPKTGHANGSPRAPRSPRVAKTAAERKTPESDCEVGFQDLTFVDFSAHKFALIAKDYCENHLRRPSSESQAFQCRVCYRAFPIGDALALHARAAHPAPSALTCPTCDACFSSSEALHQHVRTKHRKGSFSSSSSSPSSQVTADCHIDKENFLALFELQTKPQQPAPSQCAPAVLLRKDVNLADVKTMLAVTGGGNPAGQSPGAESEAASPEPAAVPEADGAATPSLVNEAAKGSEDGKRDRDRDRDGESPRSESPSRRFPCKLCRNVFPNLRALKGHSRSHLGASPYRCSICPYVSVDKSTLQRHLRTHNGERPFLCRACQYPFTTKANCERHIRKRHGKNSKQDILAVMYNGAKDNAVDASRPPRSVSPPSSSSSSFTYSYSSTPSPVGSASGGRDNVGHHEDAALDLSRSAMASFAETALDCAATPSSSSSPSGASSRKGQRNKAGNPASADPDRAPADGAAAASFGGFPPQDKPLDLALRPVDLSVKARPAPAAPIAAFCRGAFSLVVNGRGGLVAEALPSPFQGRIAPLNLAPQQQQPVKMMPGLGPLNMTVTAVAQVPPVPLPVVAPRVHARDNAKRVAAAAAATTTNLTVSGTIRNGVLQMKQQKQRRYRTERPFRCSHCPAGFTLRSNMERHVKQQHPEYWAAKVRGRKAYITPSPPASLSPPANSAPASPQLPQLQQPPLLPPPPPPPPLVVATLVTKNITSSPAFPGSMPLPPPPPPSSHQPSPATEEVANPRPVTISSEVKHAISQQIKQRKALDQQQKMQQQQQQQLMMVTATSPTATDGCGKPQQQQQQQRRAEEDDGLADLASVSRLLDTANDQSIQNMLRGKGSSGSAVAVAGGGGMTRDREREKERDCECLSGESAEGSSSPPPPPPGSASAKREGTTSPGGGTSSRKSAYTSAPNRVACNFCPRKFPWSSSLRRHLLTHTGQKPYKCPECPLFFTTKSNCDRHLVRKHHTASGSKERGGCPPTTSGTMSAGESNQAGDDSEDPDSDGCEVSAAMDINEGDEEEEEEEEGEGEGEGEDGGEEDDDNHRTDTLEVSPRGGHREDEETDTGNGSSTDLAARR